MEDVIRIGTISTVDADHGMAQVYYQDRDSTTGQLHLFAYRAEFAPPAVGDQVIVLHLPGNTCNGVILGRFCRGELSKRIDSRYYGKRPGSRI